MSIGATGSQLKLRLFLEGIEVPVIGAQVQMNLNAPATSSIQVIPTDRVLELKPRTMVHLFFWDYTKDLPDAPAGFNAGQDSESFEENVELGKDTQDPDNQLDNYKLLFGGEVMGLVLLKGVMQRQAVLQCSDWSTYWDTSYQTFISYGRGGMGNRSSMWAGGNNLFNDILDSHQGVMNRFLGKKPKSPGLESVQGLMGGIISLLEAMGGVPRHKSGINDFFTIAELKNHLMQQITAEQNDNTAKRLFSSKSFSAWLNNRTTGLGKLVSFRDMLKLLFHWVYYETVPVTTPYYIPAVQKTKTTKKIKVRSSRDLNANQKLVVRDLILRTRRYNGDAGSDQTAQNQGKVRESVEAAKIVARLKELRDEIDTFPLGDVRAFDKEGEVPTQGPNLIETQGSVRAVDGYGPPLLTGILTKRAKKAVNAAITVAESIKDIKYTEAVDTDGSGLGLIGQSPTLIRSTNSVTSIKNLANNQKKWRSLTKALIRILGVGPHTRRKTTRTKAKVDRLQTQIFRPDCFFVPPPKCNVLFPDQYTQFQYQRNFLQEVTRLRLTTGLRFISGQGSGFFNRSHFAPEMKEVKALARSQGNRGIRTLLPWEKHTGILPKFEHISEVNYRANKRQRKLTKDVRGQAKSYAQRAANFNFLKYRFAPRSMSVNCRFNPFFAPGFPGLVIDKPFIVDPVAVNQALAKAGVDAGQVFDISSFIANIGPLAQYFKAPTQYLGMPAALSHNVDQQGGVTAMTFTHARQHRINDDDFLRSWSAEVTRKRLKETVTTVLDAKELLSKGDYKNLKILIDATPQDIIEQMDRNNFPQDAEPSSTSDLDTVNQTDDHLGARDNGNPELETFAALAPFLIDTSGAAELLLDSRNVQVRTQLVRDIDEQEGIENGPFGASNFVRLRGGTSKVALSRGVDITIPSPHGKLKPKDKGKGPRKGVIKHVQVLGDSVVEISGVDMNAFVRSRKQKKALRKISSKAKSKSFFLWRRAVIHEEVTSRKQVKPIAIEESIRPPWFSPLYSNMFIGSEIYGKFFGTGSIVDQSLFITPEGEALFSGASERDEILAQVRAADGDPLAVAKILDDNAGKVLSEIPDIETSVDALAFIYGEVRRQGLDVQRFITNYTSRPIASLRNIFGSLDLEYEREGRELLLTSGEPGFHSTAVAPFGSLLGLIDNPDQEMARLDTSGKKFPISPDLDPRPERRAAVEAYADEVSIAKGSIGVGLIG